MRITEALTSLNYELTKVDRIKCIFVRCIIVWITQNAAKNNRRQKKLLWSRVKRTVIVSNVCKNVTKVNELSRCIFVALAQQWQWIFQCRNLQTTHTAPSHFNLSTCLSIYLSDWLGLKLACVSVFVCAPMCVYTLIQLSVSIRQEKENHTYKQTHTVSGRKSQNQL